MANTPPPNAAAAKPDRPVDRLFVVQLGSDPQQCRGQVEHVISGRRQAFAGLAELMQALDLPCPETGAAAGPREAR